MLLGLVFLTRKKILDLVARPNQRLAVLIPILLVLGFIPASLANNSKHALRSLEALPAVYLLVLFGLIWLCQKVQHKWRPILVLFLGSSYLLGIARFSDFYIVHYPVQLSEQRQHPWADAAKAALKLAPGFKEVIVDPRFGTQGAFAVGVPHYYFLFYSRFDPAVYQSRVGRDEGAVDFDKFKFRHINWYAEDHQGKLFVGSPWSFPLEKIPPQKILWWETFVNGQSGLMIVDGNF
jgi:hypothetical protein